uniref:Protein-tyrosine-phosphatase n=1 Tax=Mesocestoides corti TaxID=53468 RepID=A0A5K3FEA6_MESCO
MDIVKLCGELPHQVFDSKEDIHVPEFPDPFPEEDDFGEKSAAKKWSLRDVSHQEIRYFDRDEFLEQRSRRGKFRSSDSDDPLGLSNTGHIIIPYEDTSLLNNLRGLSTKGGYGGILGAYAKRHLQRKTMPLKRFNRDKVVKVGSAEFDRRTKNTIWLRLDRPANYIEADEFLRELSEDLDIRPPIAQFQLDKTGRVLLFFVPFETGLVASDVTSMMGQNPQWLKQNKIAEVGIGMPLLSEPVAAPHTVAKIEQLPEMGENPMKAFRGETGVRSAKDQVSRVGFILVIVLCSLAVLGAVLLFVQYIVRRRNNVGGFASSSKAKGSRKISERPLMASGSPSQNASTHNDFSGNQLEGSPTLSIGSPAPVQETAGHDVKQGAFRRPLVGTGGSEASTESMGTSSSSRVAQLNSTPTWGDEPVQMTLDVSTGHLILTYMEEHLRNRDRLDADWEEISTYESEEAVPCECARRPENVHKNREGCPVPYEQTRVMLSCRGNGYINASLMYDHDPRNPSYIAAETPLLGTVTDFWQMVWEQFAVVVVCLEPESSLKQVTEDPFNITYPEGGDVVSQARYWPPEGSMTFGKFEVRLVSEHRTCSDYITRSFYLKERDTGETRTVTQFHFLSWASDTPSCDAKTLLEFRRKVNKSFRAKNSPVVVHCRDGSSKTGTYLLLDLVLSRINKGVKELDVAASLEHLRDQRQGMIQTKGQFEFVLAAIAEEVNMMLNSTIASAP